jgi:hypothetical protein
VNAAFFIPCSIKIGRYRVGMQKIGESFELTATDPVDYLNCRRLSELDRAVAEGQLAKPKTFDPLLEILWERGAAHERNYVEHLAHSGLEVISQY